MPSYLPRAEYSPLISTAYTGPVIATIAEPKVASPAPEPYVPYRQTLGPKLGPVLREDLAPAPNGGGGTYPGPEPEPERRQAGGGAGLGIAALAAYFLFFK